MMKRFVTAAAALVLAMALGGCAAFAGESEVAQPAPSSSQQLQATPTQAPSPHVDTPEATFLAELDAAYANRPDLQTQIPDATDEQLLDAAKRACEQMANGTDFSAVSVIEGETSNALGIREDSALIAAVATNANLCR